MVGVAHSPLGAGAGMSGTITLQESFASALSFATALIHASPPFTAVTTPLASTVATSSSDEDQATVLSLAVAGTIWAYSLPVSPTFRFNSCFSKANASTGCVTVTSHVAVKPPSTEVAVMMQVPFPTPLTLPLLSTVATNSSSVLHVIIPSLVSRGKVLAIRVAFSLIFSFNELLEILIPVVCS